MNEKSNTWFAIVNPDAGSGKTMARWHEAEPLLYDNGIEYKFAIPDSPGNAAKRIARACESGYRHFIAVGGDGTVHQLLCGIVNFVESEKAAGKDIKISDFTLAALPIGSGNDWLKSHNLPNEHEKLIKLIAAGYFSPQDIVRAELFNAGSGKIAKTVYMANIGGYAFDASICDVVNFQKSHGVTGKVLYLNALKKQAFAQKPALTKVVVDGNEVYDGPIYSMSFGNGTYSGGGMQQTPSAVIDDGLLNVMAAPKLSFFKIMVNLKKLLTGELEKTSFLKFFIGKTVEVLPHGQGQLVEMDGDVIGRAPLRLTVLSEQINVLHLKK